MRLLTIRDLSLSEALDRKAMRAINGGVLPGGCVDPWRVPTLPAIPMPTLPPLPQMPTGFPPPYWSGPALLAA
jgi:hypothetical protein